MSTRSVAVVPSGSAPVSFMPTTSGISMKYGCPSITASASMPPTPQPMTPRPLIMVVCESVPTQGVGIGGGLAELVAELHHRREVLQVDLVHDAGARRDHPEVVEGALGELEELIALDVALAAPAPR